MSELHKLRVKIGEAEFEAQGSEESVRLQYDAFLAALQAVSVSTVGHKQLTQDEGLDSASDPLGGAAQNGGKEPDQVDPSVMRRVMTESNGLVSLLALPPTETPAPDALLMLLYG